MKIRISVLLISLFVTVKVLGAVSVTTIRTEQMNAPLGIDVRQPRLSWMLESSEKNVMQTAYHILVASTPEKLANVATGK